MPRTGPVYTLPEAAFVANTPIVAATMNSQLDDIATALTNSLARNGDGGMTAVLPLDNDGFTYLTDPNTGIHRTGADEQSIECGGVDVVAIDASGVRLAGTLEVFGGPITVDGNPLLMIGEMKIWPSETVPALWQLCRGQALNRVGFPDLWTFAAAEIAAGNLLFTNGNGTTTFTVPDMQGYVPAGSDTTGLILSNPIMVPNGSTVGAVGGAQDITLDTTMIPSHTHTGTTGTESATHTHDYSRGTAGAAKPNGAGTTPFDANTTVATGAESATHTHSFTSNATGGGAAHHNVQPTKIVNYIIYAGA